MTSKEALLDIQKRNEVLKKEGHFHIGTLTMGIIEKLVERDTPKKIEIGTSHNFKYPICPNCKIELNEYYKYANKYCKECGQRLDWSERNE